GGPPEPFEALLIYDLGRQVDVVLELEPGRQAMYGVPGLTRGAAQHHHEVVVRSPTRVAAGSTPEERHLDQVVSQPLGQRLGELTGKVGGHRSTHHDAKSTTLLHLTATAL